VPSTVRCIEITPSRVWIGTYQGLFWVNVPISEGRP